MASTTLEAAISTRKAPAVTATAAGLSSVSSHLVCTHHNNGSGWQHMDDGVIRSQKLQLSFWLWDEVCDARPNNFGAPRLGPSNPEMLEGTPLIHVPPRKA